MPPWLLVVEVGGLPPLTERAMAKLRQARAVSGNPSSNHSRHDRDEQVRVLSCPRTRFAANTMAKTSPIVLFMHMRGVVVLLQDMLRSHGLAGRSNAGIDIMRCASLAKISREGGAFLTRPKHERTCSDGGCCCFMVNSYLCVTTRRTSRLYANLLNSVSFL